MVMKGIEHGAHVIMKQKASKIGNHDAPKSDSGNGIDLAVTTNSNQNEKSYRKRKEHNEDDSEENEDDNDSEDPTTGKKDRVVWTLDLHRKFIAAVNHLGFDKAVPTTILDLMNVETLTRQNVASHLQSYRLYRKKVSAENQQAHMMEALYNSAFGSHSGVGGHWQTLNDSTQFHNNPFRSSPSSSMNMFSANDDQKMVMKGIEHGAHVIRKKKASKTGNRIDSAVTANSNQNEKSYRKRKVHDEDDSEENADDNDGEDPTARKKDRVVWTLDLHRKFIAAVNHLGFDKVVPKTILDLMNVETLTRQNVASHLQRYRLYLKKVSAENQQAHMMEALGNSAFGSHSGVGGHWQTLNDSTQFHNNRNISVSTMNNRFNTPTNVNRHGLPSSGTLQLNQTLNLNKSTNDQFKFQSALTRGNPIDVQRMSISTGLDQFQYNRGISVSPKPKVTMSFTPSSVLDISNNPMVLELNSQNKNLASQYSVEPTTIGSSMIPVNSVEPEGNLDYNYCGTLQMNQMKSQNSGISNNIGSLEDIIVDGMKQKQDKVKLMDGYYDNFSGGTSL